MSREMAPKDMAALRKGLSMLKRVNAQLDETTIPDLIEAAKDEPITKPPGRWRNLWQTLEAYECSDTGKGFEVGDVYLGTHLYPSKDAAITGAQIINEHAEREPDVWAKSKYLGPIAVEE